MTCCVQANPGLRIDIRFDQQFGIEEHYEEKCVYDWIEVGFELVLAFALIDSPVIVAQIMNGQGQKKRFCGDVAPNNGTWMGLESNPLRILFHSDLSVEKSGYKIYYKLIGESFVY